MPLFSFLEFQDINFTSAEQRRDIWKLNPSSHWHSDISTPGCPRGLAATGQFTECGLAVCRAPSFTVARTGCESWVTCSFLCWFIHWILTEPHAFCVPPAGHTDCLSDYQLTASRVSLHLPTPWCPHLDHRASYLRNLRPTQGFVKIK